MNGTEYLFNEELPAGSVLSVCGAGGKTSLIRKLRKLYTEKGKKVLVATSTHMMREEEIFSHSSSILEALAEKGSAVAGKADPRNPAKMVSPGMDVLAEVVSSADLCLIEADGARHMRFKMPYPHEPVIYPFTTHIAVVYGLASVGRKIRDVSYNPEGVAEALHCSVEDILNEDRMVQAIRETYIRKFREICPDIPVFLCPF